MTQTSVPAPEYAGGDFRVGSVFSTASAVFSRNFAKFFIVTLVAALPNLLFTGAQTGVGGAPSGWTMVVGLLLGMVLGTIAQAAILYGAFQDMRGRPVDLGESLSKGLSRFLPIVGLAILLTLGVAVGFMLLVVPGIILLTMWFVATPACVLERLGPVRSLGRSRQLTYGYRWRVFGLMILLWIVSAIVGSVLQFGVAPVAGPIVAAVVLLIWSAVFGTYYAIVVAVTYRDLRAAKEGVDMDQIAAVFD